MTSSMHDPQLGTILMVEKAIKESQSYPSINQLSRRLPKQTQHGTLKTILGYLEDSNKIMFDNDGSIIWIFADSEKRKRSLARSTKLR
jgi:hypothetical protein